MLFSDLTAKAGKINFIPALGRAIIAKISTLRAVVLARFDRYDVFGTEKNRCGSC